MDPITIVASCVAVLQVLDRIAVLSSKFRGFLDAPNDAQRLINESLDLMIVLDRIKTFNATYPTRRDMIICELLVSCERILSRVENLVHTVVTNSRLHNPKVQKLVWFHKRRDVAVLRQELRDIKSALCLQFLVVTMFAQGELTTGISNLIRMVPATESNEYTTQDAITQTTNHITDSTVVLGTQPWSSLSPNMFMEISEQPLDGRKTPASACSKSCPCHCHLRTTFHFGSLTWIGYLTISAIGSPFQKPSACNEPLCRRKSVPLLSVLYITPNWISLRALALVLVNGPSPKVTLYFPRVIPTDANMAVSIRKGDCDRIRELITNGDASPLDIVGPYGLTALHLAIAYGQIEVYNLLTSMGAHNYPTTIAGRIGDITIFWSRFSRLKCSLPGVDVIEDLFHLCALDKYVNIIQANGPAILDQVEPLSRLHKTVLGLNYECSEQVIRLSRNCINEVDALKRTALHWAVCQGDLEKTEQLLRCGADPDISDRDAKTALHLASGLGYVAITDALISAGANLDARDSVLNTPLHIAAMQNRTSIIAHLVDAGAEFDSRSGLGETPLMCACLSDAYDSIILLFSLGADLEAKCNWGCSALGRGVKLNRHCTVKLLLELGAEVDTVRHDQRTILHLIAQATDKAMMNLLIDSGVYGFDANATDMDGLTALEHLELRDDADELFEIFSQFWQKENDRERTTQSETFFDALEIQIQG